MQQDIAIVGAGPAGLALARSLRGSGLSVAVIERQPQAALGDPAFDGREIALTPRSVALLRQMGVWEDIPPGEVFPMRAAKVLNGASPFALTFAPKPQGRAEPAPLGVLVANHLIRRALYRGVEGLAGVTLIAGAGVSAARRGPGGFHLALSDGRELAARLLVVADSRFSATRDQIGVGAQMNRLGRSMLVCRMSHPADHGGVATEWFDHRQTLALLPLGPGQSSVVITLPATEMEALAGLEDAAFGDAVTRRFKRRLGPMRLVGARHVYPLVTAWAHRFAGSGFALIGDAAVGMHPVTAHGFNLGLAGQADLARRIVAARAAGRDFASAAALAGYEAAHRRRCRPLFLATNATARLFTTETAPARLARHALIRIAQGATPIRDTIVRSLSAT